MWGPITAVLMPTTRPRLSASALGRAFVTSVGSHGRQVDNVIQTDAALHAADEGGWAALYDVLAKAQMQVARPLRAEHNRRTSARRPRRRW
jgi:hypothetical protein